LLVVALVAYLLFAPSGKTYTLASYEYAAVARKDLVESIQVNGQIGYAETAVLEAPIGGEVEHVAVKAGDVVAKGALIARMRSKDAALALSADDAALTKRKRDRERIVLERSAETERTARDEETGKTRLERAKADFDKIAKLYDAKAATKRELDQAEDAYRAADSALRETIAVKLAGGSAYEFNLKNAEADIAQLESRLAADRAQVSSLRIVSPIAGKVIEIAAEPGAWLNPRARVAAVVDSHRPVLDLKVDERLIGRLRAGQAVGIAFGGKKTTGVITEIGTRAVGGSETASSLVAVTVGIDDPSLEFVPGMSAQAEIAVGAVSGALVLPRGQYLTTGNEACVYRVEGSKARKTEVTFGLMTGSEAQVTSGVAEGDLVIISGYQDFSGDDEIRLDSRGGKKR
jgi:multidrug efflux pump subunit AcrA (membrane-fusion protein)